LPGPCDSSPARSQVSICCPLSAGFCPVRTRFGEHKRVPLRPPVGGRGLRRCVQKLPRFRSLDRRQAPFDPSHTWEILPESSTCYGSLSAGSESFWYCQLQPYLPDMLEKRFQMTETRALPRRVAGVVERLEIDQPRVVTMRELARIAVDVGACSDIADAPKLAYWLQTLGWLGSLRTEGVWEFLPGARAGAYGSGDRFIEFRAQRAVYPWWPGVLAMESAASLLGLAQRLPTSEVVALPAGVALPKALSVWRYVTVALPDSAQVERDGLVYWSMTGLIAGIAFRPSGYRDLAGLAQWLPEAGAQLDQSILMEALEAAASSVRQRAAYLARLAGADAVAMALLAGHLPVRPVWYGPTRAAGARYDPVTGVSDGDLAPYLTGGFGS